MDPGTGILAHRSCGHGWRRPGVPLRPPTVDFRELEGLPAPVQRYFRAALTEGAASGLEVSVEHTGTFNMRVPLRGEVAWLLREGRNSYWRGQITSLVYHFAGSDAVPRI